MSAYMLFYARKDIVSEIQQLHSPPSYVEAPILKLDTSVTSLPSKTNGKGAFTSHRNTAMRDTPSVSRPTSDARHKSRPGRSFEHGRTMDSQHGTSKGSSGLQASRQKKDSCSELSVENTTARKRAKKCPQKEPSGEKYTFLDVHASSSSTSGLTDNGQTSAFAKEHLHKILASYGDINYTDFLKGVPFVSKIAFSRWRNNILKSLGKEFVFGRMSDIIGLINYHEFVQHFPMTSVDAFNTFKTQASLSIQTAKACLLNILSSSQISYQEFSVMFPCVSLALFKRMSGSSLRTSRDCSKEKAKDTLQKIVDANQIPTYCDFNKEFPHVMKHAFSRLLKTIVAACPASQQSHIYSHRMEPYARASLRITFATKLQETPTQTCVCCYKLLYPSQGKQVTDVQVLSVLRKHQLSTTNSAWICNICHKFLSRQEVPANNWKCVDTGSIPSCLLGLNLMEKRLISLAHPFMTLLSLPYGQLAMKGQAIHFNNDVQVFHDSLPLEASQTNIILLTVHKDRLTDRLYSVRQDKLLSALHWLTQNNALYKNVTINIELAADLHSDIGQDKAETIIDSGVIPGDYINSLDLRNTMPGVKAMSLPKHNTPPINTFKAPHLEESCFFWLFPKGIGGFETLNGITHTQYIQTRLLSKDPKFRSYVPYLFWLLNTFEQRKLQQCISIATRKQSLSSMTAQYLTTRAASDPSFLDNSFVFMKNIRGTEASWHAVKSELFALFRCLGPPTLFVTLSANDMHWDSLFTTVLATLGSNKQAQDLTDQEKRTLVIENPVVVARFFSRRWQVFLSNVLLQKNGPLGVVRDNFWRIEFQLRGSPHVHALFWLEDAPDIETADPEFVCNYINRFISCKIPPETHPLHTQVTQLQTHNHKPTYQRKKSSRKATSCRFRFPQPPQPQTALLTPGDSRNHAHFYVRERTKEEMFINSYNLDILEMWDANMDIQLVGSVIGTAIYITTYICKPETSNLQERIQDALASNVNMSTAKTLRAIGNVLLTNRQVSAQEAAFRLCGLQMKGVSRQVKFVNTCRPKDRIRLLKPATALERLDENDTDVFEPNLLTRCTRRPYSDHFNKLSLASFVMNYDIHKCAPQAIPLCDNTGYIKRRKLPACLRFPHKTPEQDGDDYYYQLLVLYMPFRNETEDLLGSYPSAYDSFVINQKHLQVPDNFAGFAEQVNKTVNMISTFRPEALDNIVNANVAAGSHEFLEQMTSKQAEIEQGLYTINRDIIHDDICLDEREYGLHLSRTELTNNEYTTLQSSLNASQKQVWQSCVDHATLWFKSTLDKSARPPPLHLFVSGGAGTGKSFLLKAIRVRLSAALGASIHC